MAMLDDREQVDDDDPDEESSRVVKTRLKCRNNKIKQ